MLALITFSIIPFFFLCFLFLVVGYGAAFFLVPRKETSAGNTDNYSSNLSEIEKKIHTAIEKSSGSNPEIDSQLEKLKTQHAGEIQKRDNALQAKDNEIKRQDDKLTKQDEKIEELERQILELKSQEKPSGFPATEKSNKTSEEVYDYIAQAKKGLKRGLQHFLDKNKNKLTDEEIQQVKNLNTLFLLYNKNESLFHQHKIHVSNIDRLTQQIRGLDYSTFEHFIHIESAIKQFRFPLKSLRTVRYPSDEFAMKFHTENTKNVILFYRRLQYFETFKQLQDANGNNYDAMYMSYVDTYKNLPLDASDESIQEALQNIHKRGLQLKNSAHENPVEEVTAPIARTTSDSVFPEPRTKKDILSLIHQAFENAMNDRPETKESDLLFIYHAWYYYNKIVEQKRLDTTRRANLKMLIDKFCKEKNIELYEEKGSKYSYESDLRDKYLLHTIAPKEQKIIDWPVYFVESVSYPHIQSSKEKKKGKASFSIIDSFVAYVKSFHKDEHDISDDCIKALHLIEDFQEKEFSEDTWLDLLNCFYRCWSTFLREYFKTEDVRYLKLNEVQEHIISFTKRECNIQLHTHVPYESNFWNEKDAERVEKLGRDELSSSYFDEENPPIGSIEEIGYTSPSGNKQTKIKTTI